MVKVYNKNTDTEITAPFLKEMQRQSGRGGFNKYLVVLQDFSDLSGIFGLEESFLLVAQPSFCLLQPVLQVRQQLDRRPY